MAIVMMISSILILPTGFGVLIDGTNREVLSTVFGGYVLVFVATLIMVFSIAFSSPQTRWVPSVPGIILGLIGITTLVAFAGVVALSIWFLVSVVLEVVAFFLLIILVFGKTG